MSTTRKLLLAGTSALLLVMLVAGAALAQSAPTPMPNQSSANYGQYFLDRLANALGITRDQLNAAGKQAASESIDKQVQDGRITAEQAAQRKQNLDQADGFGGWFGFGKGFGGRGGHEGLAPRGGFLGGNAHVEGVAKALNLSVEDLTAQLRAGKSVADLAKEKNVSADQVKSAVVASVSAQVDQAVADGRLTAEQATRIKDQLNGTSADQFLQNGGFGMHRGPFGGRGQGQMPSAPTS
mgnify:CR=1 FL=1